MPGKSHTTKFGTLRHLQFVFSRKMPIRSPSKHDGPDKLVIFPDTQTRRLGAGEGSTVVPMLHGVLCRLIAAPIDSKCWLTGSTHDRTQDSEPDSFCRAGLDRRLKSAKNPAPSSTLL